ncbi:MAG: hypothetical protein DCC75_09285 [Proteobacteria bacterium]|nr:MAG: hypothetical protein DCC75_09285 [Pseudomonadota bacterium]
MPDERKITNFRPTPANLEIQELTISRRSLKEALERAAINKKVRVVPVFNSSAAAEANIPQYRLFEVAPESAYHLLGLRNADVMVAANERIIVNSFIVPTFVQLLPAEQTAQIEIRREERPILFKYTFVE